MQHTTRRHAGDRPARSSRRARLLALPSPAPAPSATRVCAFEWCEPGTSSSPSADRSRPNAWQYGWLPPAA